MTDNGKKQNIFEVNAVQRLGDQIGYGHLMYLASALWRKKLVEKHGEECGKGAFVPTLRCLIVDDWMENVEKEIKIYDDIVKCALGG